MNITIENIEKVLAEIIHPEYDKSLIELSLVQNLSYSEQENIIKFRLVFHRPDPLSESIKEVCIERLTKEFPEAKVEILVLIDAPKITQKQKGVNDRKGVRGVDNIIAIASGKGGVGKSSVAVNLAVTLAKKGLKVGVVDADIYGPSIPKMIGCEGEVPAMSEEKKIIPIEKFGVKWLSIGFFVESDQALIWRGPMATGALKQLVFDAQWGELDYLLIDLPPGTGDIHISMIQEVALTGAIIVTTPQSIALVDVEKGINMFRNKNINTPILGVVENMSWFTPKELPQNRYYIFGKDGGVRISQEHNIPLLAQIPIVMSIMNGGEEGIPGALKEENIFRAFNDIAVKL